MLKERMFVRLWTCLVILNVQTYGSAKEIFHKTESNTKRSVALISLHEITPLATFSEKAHWTRGHNDITKRSSFITLATDLYIHFWSPLSLLMITNVIEINGLLVPSTSIKKA